MLAMNLTRLVLSALGLSAMLGLAAFAAGGGGDGKGTTVPATWKEIERLKEDQKFAEALERVESLRTAAQAAGQSADWTRALLEAAELRGALGEFAAAVKELRRADWPADRASRAALSLHLGASLRQYLASYGWEVRQRERVAGEGPFDLESATAEQIAAEAVRAYAAAWSERETLGARPAGSLPGMTKNTYPAGIRPTLRDSLTYLLAEILADTSLWTPEQLAERRRLDAKALAGRAPKAAAPGEAELHPLEQLAAVLSDLERWHRQAGRPEAELEAMLERSRLLSEGFEADADHKSVREALAEQLPSFRSYPWWSEGMATLADLVKGSDEPGATAEAHAIARRGALAYPASSGGRRCRALVEQIEAPDYGLQAMAVDAPGKRSIEVTHRNLPRLYFRALAVDLETRLGLAVEQDVWPSGDELLRLLGREQPAAAWTVELPSTPDFETHRTFVTPPLLRSGAYVVVASATPAFGERGNRLNAVRLLVSDLVLLEEWTSGSQVRLRAVSGSTGQPAGGAEISLYRVDWRQPARRVGGGRVDADGLLETRLDDGASNGRLLILGRWQGQIALRAEWRSTWEAPAPTEQLSTLLFTDRALYRPGQVVHWKGLAYRVRSDVGPLAPLVGHSLKVSLVDANNEVVASGEATTNGFGTASGELTIPSGRLLGEWRLTSEPNGAASIAVEEYKRPTFEVELLDPESPLRLNREATLRAEARYLFGLPLPDGRAEWRGIREPVLPPWLFWFSGKGICTCFRVPLDTRPLTVATGSGVVGSDGRVAIVFDPRADEREKGSGVTYAYRVEVEVTDSGGETRSATRSFRLGWAAVEGALEPPGGFLVAGQSATVAATRADLEGVPRAGEASWRLVRLLQPERALLPADRPVEASPLEPGETPPLRTPGDLLRPRWERGGRWESVVAAWQDGDDVVRGQLAHGGDGRATIALPPLAPGAYRLRWESRDGAGQRAEAQRDLLVAGSGSGHLALPAILLAERARVRVGETARLLLHSALPGQTLFLELFRDGKAIRRERRLGGAAPELIELPVAEGDRGGFSVRLSVVSDHQFLLSDVAIDVPREDRELKLELATFRDLLEPGQRETWRVVVKDPQGRPLGAGAAELLAAMYDRSLDAFRPFAPPQPRQLFPVRAGAPALVATLGLAEHGGMWGRDWNDVEAVEGFAPDELAWMSSDGIGGPGGRQMVRMAKGGRFQGQMLGMVAAAPASAPPPPHPAEQAIAETIAVAAEAFSVDVTAPVAMRSDFAETAFFQPHLVTGADGAVAIEFKVPEALTSWRFWLSAVTRELAFGSLEAEARTRKELMVRPYLPRFLREGDRARLKVVVNNAASVPLDGEAEIVLRDEASGEDLTSAFGLAPEARRRSFRIAPGGGEDLEFQLLAPRRLGRVLVEVAARAGGRSDGERRPLPLLPSRVHLVQSRFAALNDRDRRELDFPDLREQDPTRIDEKLVVTVDGQLFAGMLAALPYLADYPYECTEQTLNRFLSTGMISSLFEKRPELAELGRRLAARRTTPLEAWKADDPNRRLALEETPWLELSRGGAREGDPAWLRVLDPEVARAQRESALARLVESQLPSGAFPWFPGGPPSPYMTLYLMSGFARAAEFGVPVPREMVERGWRYLARDFREQWRRDLKKGCCFEYLTFLGYVASSYPDPSWAEAGLSASERREILDLGFRHWREHSPQLKLMLAMTLARSGRGADAKLVLASVMDSAKSTRDEGTYWRPEERSWLWYNDTIETHAWAVRALLEVAPEDPRRAGLVQWLFLNRQLNHWKSTRATAEVLYSVARHLEKEGSLLTTEEIRVAAAGRTARFVFDPAEFAGTERQMVVPGEALAQTTRPAVVVEKDTKGLAFASATWSFSTEQPPARGDGDLFSVERRYFRRVKQGRETTLEPLTPQSTVAVGDEIEVQLSLRSRMGAEYVQLRDPRAAGLEPDRPDSGWRWDLGITRYEETRDSATSFFFEQLPAGEYTLKYRLRAATAGDFRVGPATVQSMYAPEFAAYSGAATMAIAP